MNSRFIHAFTHLSIESLNTFNHFLGTTAMKWLQIYSFAGVLENEKISFNGFN